MPANQADRQLVSFAIVGADVAHNFAIEIFDRAEDARA
jgi:hypothetical protein